MQSQKYDCKYSHVIYNLPTEIIVIKSMHDMLCLYRNIALKYITKCGTNLEILY